MRLAKDYINVSHSYYPAHKNMQVKTRKAICILLVFLMLHSYVPVHAFAVVDRVHNDTGYRVDDYYQFVYDSYLISVVGPEQYWWLQYLANDSMWGFVHISEDLNSNQAFQFVLDAEERITSFSFSDIYKYFFGEDPRQEDIVEYYVTALSSLMMTLEANLDDVRNEQARADATMGWEDYLAKGEQLAFSSMAYIAEGSVFETAFSTCGISVDIIADSLSSFEQAEFLAKNANKYLAYHNLLQIIIDSTNDVNLKKAATCLKTATDKCFEYYTEHFVSNYSGTAANAMSSYYFDVLDKVLENARIDGSFRPEEIKALGGLCNAAKAVGSFKLGVDIGKFVGDVLLKSSDTILRYYEIAVMSEVREALINEIYKLNAQIKSPEDFEAIKDACELLEELLYVTLRGEYCVYMLKTQDVGLLSLVTMIGQWEFTEEWFDGLVSTISWLQTIINGIFPEWDSFAVEQIDRSEAHYYEVIENGIYSWEGAEQYCESLGGHLATITTQEENDHIYRLLTEGGYSSAYFGLTDSVEEGTWRWVTGEPVVYTNWHSSEPNRENSNEDYAMFYFKFNDGSWNDGDFGGRTANGGTAFICEWDTYEAYEGYLIKHDTQLPSDTAESLSRFKTSTISARGEDSAGPLGICGDNLTWCFDGSTGILIIEGGGAMYDYEENYNTSNNVVIYDHNGQRVVGTNVVPWVDYTEQIEAVLLSGSITSIGNYAFKECSNLKNVVIPDSVTSIGKYAFMRTGLKSITVPGSVKTIGASAFSYCPLSELDIGYGVVSIGNSAFYGTQVAELVIPDSVTTIGSFAFWADSNLSSLIIPDSVTSIGTEAFAYCYGLERVKLSNNITRIEPGTFYLCNTLKDITLPDHLVSVGAGAFNAAAITSIKIPVTITDIAGKESIYESGAFSGCTSLTDIYYDGTMEQWCQVSIGEPNESLTLATIHCLDGTLSSSNLSYIDNTLTAVTEETSQESTGKNCADITVNFEHSEDLFESAHITAYNADGQKLWEYSTGEYDRAQLYRVSEIGIYRDRYYFNEDRSIIALDLNTGSLLWRNDEYIGATTDFCFDDRGTLYLCGWLGPDFCAIDWNGNTLCRIEHFDAPFNPNIGVFDPVYYWADSIELQAERYAAVELIAEPEGYKEQGNGYFFYVDLNDFSYSRTTPSDASTALQIQINDSVPTIESTGLIPFSGNLTDYHVISFQDAYSSSTLTEGSITFWPSYAINRDTDRPWVEGVEGDGNGEYLTLYFGKEETIDLLGFHLGYASHYEINNRPKLLQLNFSDGSSAQYEFPDLNQICYVQLSKPVTTSYITITILSVYPGTLCQDTCITLVSAYASNSTSGTSQAPFISASSGADSLIATGCVFPDSSNRYLTDDEIAGLTDGGGYTRSELIRFAINELYARNHMSFGAADLNALYSSQSWYANYGYTDRQAWENMNEIERYNLDNLIRARKAMQEAGTYYIGDTNHAIPSATVPISSAKSVYGQALLDGNSYSVEEKVHIIANAYYDRKNESNEYRDGYTSRSNSNNSTGYRLGFYYGDGLVFYAEVIEGSSILVKLYYWNGELIGCRDYRYDGNLYYKGSGVLEGVASEFYNVYEIGMNSL